MAADGRLFVRIGIVWCGMVYSMVWRGMVMYDMALYGMVWYGHVVWCSLMCYGMACCCVVYISMCMVWHDIYMYSMI